MPKNVLFDRQKVLQSVTKLFWQKGYNGTSMQDLVDATGLNRSSLYNTFGDKFQLYMESLRHYQQWQDSLLSIDDEDMPSPKAHLLSVFENIKQNVLNDSTQLGCFLTNCTSELGSQDPRVKAFLLQNKNHVVEVFENLIKKAQKAGEIDEKKDAHNLALYLFSNLHGLRLMSMVLAQPSEIEAITEEIMNVL